MSKKKDHFLLGFTLGSGVAFAAALFLAPKTGVETQEKLRNLKDQVTSKGRLYYYYAADAAGDLKAGTSDKLSDFLDKTPDVDLGGKVASAKQPFDQVTSSLRSHFDTAKEQLGDKTDKDNYDDIVIDATDTNATPDTEDVEKMQSAFQEAKSEDGVESATPEVDPQNISEDPEA